MDIQLHYNAQSYSSDELIIVGATSTVSKAAESKTKKAKETKETKKAVLGTANKMILEVFNTSKAAKYFQGERGEILPLSLPTGEQVLVVGLGDKKKLTHETVRRATAEAYKATAQKFKTAALDLDSFSCGDLEATLTAVVEALGMTSYVYDKHHSVKKAPKLQKVFIDTATKKGSSKKLEDALYAAIYTTESIAVARDFVNEPPNILNSEVYANLLAKDAESLPRVKTKILNKAMLKKEKMDLFLSVNNGSGYEARLVHLTYTPKKATAKTKHIVLVGKGLTFDTGGYSLKPADSMVNMKFDMAGSSTVYGAFRAAALLDAPIKITCILGITDNAINSFATMPDSIVKARNGKTVEILNTDAEGRLVLADCLDYACDQKPDAIIDAATLTGACLVAVGHETCAIMGNNKKLSDSLLQSAEETHERMWPLPMFEEFSQDIKSVNADLKNMGSNRFGGSSKAGAFLKEFIRDDIPWAHLDIAGIGDSQGHLPYCPPKGASGLIIRTLVRYLMNTK